MLVDEPLLLLTLRRPDCVRPNDRQIADGPTKDIDVFADAKHCSLEFASVRRSYPPLQALMTEVFDVTTILFLVIAVVIFLRLRSVLGRRTGHERPPFDQFSKAPGTEDDNNVVSLPKRRGGTEPAQPVNQSLADDVYRWEGIADQGSALADQLDTLRDADPGFDAKSFLDGARVAYEMIVTAFAGGDRKALRPLLSPDVFDGFSSAIDDREQRGERIESRFVGIDDATITDAAVKNGIAQVTVRFKSGLISATYGRGGDVIEGDPKAVTEVTDVWTFARPATSRDPNWQLIATETAA